MAKPRYPSKAEIEDKHQEVFRLGQRPDDASLLGMASIAPPPEPKRPGFLRRAVGGVVKLPLRVVALPFRAVAGLARLARRRGHTGDEHLRQ